MNQHDFVKRCQDIYEALGLTPEPGGEWQEAHYPKPKGMGEKTVWLTFNDHQQQGLYQSEEYSCQCFFNASVLNFLSFGPFVSDWFELWDLYDKWKGGNSRKVNSKNVKIMNAHPNTKRAKKETRRKMNLHPNTIENRKSNGRKTGPENIKVCHSHPNTKSARIELSKRTSKPIVCVETGQEYTSAYAASKITGLPRDSISQACRRGCKAGGHYWQFLQQG